MSIIKSVSVTGLWGEHSVELQLHPDVNFLIGRNGTGKTTVVNLIAAVLNGDYPILQRIPFETVDLGISDKGGKTVPIHVQKVQIEDSPFYRISYKLGNKSSAREYILSDLDETLAYRRNVAARRHQLPLPLETGLMHQLRTLIRVNWLSIHRSTLRAPADERSYESSVDKKLNQLGNRFVRFFSSLVSEAEVQRLNFPRTVFLSLLHGEISQHDLTEPVRKMNLAEEQNAFTDILQEFKISDPDQLDRVNAHFALVRVALAEEKAGFTTAEVAALVSMWSIHRIVQAWQKSKERQTEILKPREDFLTILNDMVLKDKRFFINDANELKARIGQREVDLGQLSSGEKQLVIILGEALLQEKRPWVYIADEPELSLHVAWQERLTSTLRQINPNAQIIFATHSPDIVSNFATHVLDMETLLK